MFAEMEVIKIAAVRGHTHGESAAARSSASAFIDCLAASAGKRAVFLQGSAADHRNGREMTRVHYWGKDWNVGPRQVEKDDGDLSAMVDVDYHVDMPTHLARNFRPLVLYTVQPARAGVERGEYKYCFNANNELDYSVSGGGRYVHKVWNWKGDSVSATRSLCGIPITRSIFNIERKRVDDDHQIVLLTPLVKFRLVRCWVSYWGAQCHELERLRPVTGTFSRLVANTTDGMMVSTAKCGGYLSANVSISVDEAIASAARTTTKLTHSTVKAKMAPPEPGRSVGSADFTGSEILLEYHLVGNTTGDRVDIVNGVRNFQWVKNYQDFEPENPSMVAFMRPLYDGAFVPDDCKNNDERMVKERVTKLKPNSKDKPEMTPFLLTAMQEFASEFKATVGGDIFPYDYEVVYERQHKPSQRRILEESEHGVGDNRSAIFQKREAYARCNDPRAISQINGVDKREYSCYTYPLADRMKRCSWYAFGKPPIKIAARVAELCTDSISHVDSTDFSRMDGRVSDLARILERLVMSKVYMGKYHLEIFRLLKTQTGLRAKTRNGVVYNTGNARASGSPETSIFNTILNAFIAFLSFRMTRTDGRYMDKAEAWCALGLYGGDDGLTPDQDRKAAEKAALMMGQVMTVERTKKGEPGVAFLARHYGPDVWWGDSNSCCDIRRQLAKFHVTTRLCSNVTPLTKLREKAFAFSLTDANTPVIGWFVSRAMELMPMNRSQYRNLLGIWNSDIARQQHYPNVYADWMVDLMEKQIPDFDTSGFFHWVQYSTLEQLLDCPAFALRPPPNPQPGLVAVDGDFVGAPEEEETKEEEAPTPAPTREVTNDARKRFRGRKPKPRARQKHASSKRGRQ